MDSPKDGTIEVAKEHWHDLTGTLPDQQFWEYNGEVLEDDIALSEYGSEKGISLQRVEQEDKGECMNELELDHFSRLLDTVFETFHCGGEPKSEVIRYYLY